MIVPFSSIPSRKQGPSARHSMYLFLFIAVFGFKQVVFEGIRGNSYTGDIALDDISFTVGADSCTLQPYDALPPGMTTATPTTSTPTTIGK